MSLTNIYVMSLSRFPAFFERIRDAQAPEILSQQLLKDWGFTSSNDRSFIPLLKALGFLSQDGRPTQRYLDYRDHSQSRAILGQALKDAYADLFLIKEKPSESDRDAIRGKFKSTFNTSDNVASLQASTFLKLLEMADLDTSATGKSAEVTEPSLTQSNDHATSSGTANGSLNLQGLHYNIQIHLPPTKDIEVYNAIFKSMKEHLFEG